MNRLSTMIVTPANTELTRPSPMSDRIPAALPALAGSVAACFCSSAVML